MKSSWNPICKSHWFAVGVLLPSFQFSQVVSLFTGSLFTIPLFPANSFGRVETGRWKCCQWNHAYNTWSAVGSELKNFSWWISDPHIPAYTYTQSKSRATLYHDFTYRKVANAEREYSNQQNVGDTIFTLLDRHGLTSESRETCGGGKRREWEAQ